jgi:eukaryotic-like serine/threonine-protein kinase
MISLVLLLSVGAFEPEALLPGNPWALRGHTDSITAIAFSPDATQLASASRDKTVKLWNLKTGEATRTLTGAESQLSSLSFSADGKRLAIGDIGLQVRVIDVATGTLVKAIAHPDAVGEVALNSDGTLLAVAGLTDNSAVYELSKEGKKYEFRGRTARFSADGKTLLISSGNGSFSLLDAKTGKARKTITTPKELPLTTMTESGTTIASWTASGVDVRLWNEAGKAVTVLKGPVAELDRRSARVTGVGLLPDGKRVVVGGGDGLVRLWSVEKTAVVHTWTAEKSSAVAVSPDGVWVAVADSLLVKLWKLP